MYAIGDSVPEANITRSVGEKVPVCEPGNYTVTTGDPCSESTEEGAFNLEQLWIKKVAYVLIAMGMVRRRISFYVSLSLLIMDLLGVLIYTYL